MTVTCSGYTASVIPGSNEITLRIEGAKPTDPNDYGLDPTSNRVLYLSDVAQLLKVTKKTVEKWSRRKKNRLPMMRGPGHRPRILMRDLYRWVTAGSALAVRNIFG